VKSKSGFCDIVRGLLPGVRLVKRDCIRTGCICRMCESDRIENISSSVILLQMKAIKAFPSEAEDVLFSVSFKARQLSQPLTLSGHC